MIKIKSWEEASHIAHALKSWLADHCPGCGTKLTRASLDGARCMAVIATGHRCGQSFGAVLSLEQAVQEHEIRLGTKVDEDSF